MMKICLRRIAFVVLLFFCASMVNQIFEYRSIRHRQLKEFFADDARTAYEILAFGPSYVYCTVNPVELWRSYNLRMFAPGTAIQPVEMTEHYVEMALDRYDPQLIIVGASMFVYHPEPVTYNEGFAHMATDPIPFGLDKWQMLNDQHLGDPVEDYLVPFIKYHVRWKNLSLRDFVGDFREQNQKTDVFFGYQIHTRVKSHSLQQIDFSRMTRESVSIDNLRVLDRIVEMTRKKGVKLLLLNAPRGVGRALHRQASLHDYAKKKGIDFLDLLEVLDSTGIDNRSDYHDGGHLNVHGAEKATRYIGKYLLEHYNLNTNHTVEVRAQWDADCARYDQLKAAAIAAQKGK